MPFPSFQVKVTNYRSFSVPLELTLKAGLVALVGPNNGGKSNVLRFFFELRPLFQMLARPVGTSPNLHTVLNQQGNLGAQINFNQVPDRAAVFPASNSEPMTLEISAPSPSKTSNNETYYTPDAVLIEIARDGNARIRIRDNDGIAVQASWIQNTPYVIDARSQRRFDLTSYVDIFKLLAEAFYIGSFRNVINQGANAAYFDLATGSELVNRWKNYQAGDNIAQATAAIGVISELKRVFRFTNLQLLPTANGNDIRAIVDERPFLLSELGSGVSQFFVTILNLELSRRSIVLIDEPELGLHPQLQNELLQSIARRSDVVVFTTHSLGLARNMSSEVYTVARNGPSGTSTLRNFNSLHNPVEMLGELSYSGNYDLGFRKILLVEGPTEVRLVRSLLNRLEVNHGILPLPLGGSSMISPKAAHSLIDVRRLSEKVYALVDSERPSDAVRAIPERLKFERSCKRAGICCHLTELRSTESYFSDAAVKGVIGPGYGALTPFEKTPENWPKQENWRISEQMNLIDFNRPDLVDFLKKVVAD